MPLDYAKPDGATVSIAVLKAEANGHAPRLARGQPRRPGGSGVDYAAAADFIVSKQVRDSYDIVGFDPRGVGSSQPVDCLDDRQLDAFLGADPTPDTKAEEQAFAAGAKAFAATCAAKAGPLLAHVSTIEAAKDMDILRAALGAPEAGLPRQVLRHLPRRHLRRPVPQARSAGSCSTASSPPTSARRRSTRARPRGSRRRPAPTSRTASRAATARSAAPSTRACSGCATSSSSWTPRRSGSTTRTSPALTEGWGSLGIAAAMYDQGSWGALTQALRVGLHRATATT